MRRILLKKKLKIYYFKEVNDESKYNQQKSNGITRV